MIPKKIINYLVKKYSSERNYPDTPNFLQKIVYTIDAAKYKFAAPYVKGMKVLNIACGEGYSSDILATFGANDVYGVDYDRKTIANARKKYRNPRIKFFCQNAEHLQFKDNEFDAAVSMETIEHLRHPELFLRGLKRITKPNGLIILSTPNGSVTEKNGLRWATFHVKKSAESALPCPKGQGLTGAFIL